MTQTTAQPLLDAYRRVWRRDDELHEMRCWLTDRLGDSDQTYVVVTIANELAANALKHTRSGQMGGSYTVMLCRRRDILWVAVTDQGADTVPTPKPLDAVSEGGRGLALVAQLAAECGGMWGHMQVPGGRRTWATLAL